MSKWMKIIIMISRGLLATARLSCYRLSEVFIRYSKRKRTCGRRCRCGCRCRRLFCLDCLTHHIQPFTPMSMSVSLRYSNRWFVPPEWYGKWQPCRTTFENGTASAIRNVSAAHYRRRRVSRVRIVGAGGRRNVRPCRIQQRTVYRCALKVVMWWYRNFS